MRLLIDANLSPRIADRLCAARFEAIHVVEVGLLHAADTAILKYAAEHDFVIVSADSDFGELLAVSPGAVRPSVVLLRSADRRTPDQQAELLAANLPVMADALKAGALASIARGRLRIRSLPIRPATPQSSPPGRSPK